MMLAASEHGGLETFTHLSQCVPYTLRRELERVSCLHKAYILSF